MKPCYGCGSHNLGQPGSNDCRTKCPAWGKKCLHCTLPNHFASVCHQKLTTSANALIANVNYDDTSNIFTISSNSYISKIPATLSVLSASQQPTHNTDINMKIFPDSGAAICLAGTKHLPKLNINMDQLIPCTKVVSAVGGSKLKCNGWLPIKFQIGTQVTTQPLYICDKVDRIYFSCQGCLETNIILPSFLYPMEKPTTKHDIATIATQQVPPTNPPPPPSLPTYPPPPSPPPLPYPLTPDNIPKLKTCLLEQFRNTTFNMKSPFPAMNSKPAHIHLKPCAKPYVRHTPIHIPIHW